MGARRGFTLLELVIVLLILGVAAAAVVPRVGAGARAMEERTFVSDFVGAMRGARLSAMNGGGVEVFRIDGRERRYGAGAGPFRPIPENVDIFADGLPRDPRTGHAVIEFYPDGSHVGRELDIAFSGRRAVRITIDPLFGTIRWARIEPR